ncbi:flagellar biosynthesis protein FlaG [Heliobacterium undosum]|uniref:Flagellar biosynthesis protein FlaG n=1 Tax=Heliomicrobium undosum TaxID=121734 RepID=A0A845KZ45_9FIRM|nr:flagellar protein FlaG [Heliomicrobium undosum]MZP29277.1 flagellar biosynthesis protein FlaG [Heliomicrobium undosum]
MSIQSVNAPAPFLSNATPNGSPAMQNGVQTATAAVMEDETEKAVVAAQTVQAAQTAQSQPAQSLQPAPISKDALTKKMEETNAFLQSINTDLRFRWHEKAEQLMVEVYDHRNDKVLKTFPPKEFLDTLAKIRDYVGSLIDKKV